MSYDFRDCLYIENGKAIFRGEDGKFLSVPMPKFRDGQIVALSAKHYSDSKITIVVSPSWTDSRGWVYGEDLLNPDGSCGGKCWWNNEDFFEEITDPLMKIMASKIDHDRKIKQLSAELERAKAELDKIDYALSLANGGKS